MQTASFTGFIETLFYIIAFYYVFKFLAKLFLPLLIKKVVEKAGQNFQQHQQNSHNPPSRSKDDVIIDTANAKKSRETKIVGDYVDYEEID